MTPISNNARIVLDREEGRFVVWLVDDRQALLLYAGRSRFDAILAAKPHADLPFCDFAAEMQRERTFDTGAFR